MCVMQVDYDAYQQYELCPCVEKGGVPRVRCAITCARKCASFGKKVGVVEWVTISQEISRQISSHNYTHTRHDILIHLLVPHSQSFEPSKTPISLT